MCRRSPTWWSRARVCSATSSRFGIWRTKSAPRPTSTSVEWAVALCHSRAEVDQVLRVRMQSLPRFPARLPDQIARPGALDDDAQLEAGHRDIPIETWRFATACHQVRIEQFAPAGQPAECGKLGTRGDRAGLQRPTDQHPAQVEQWVADGTHLPVDE